MRYRRAKRNEGVKRVMAFTIAYAVLLAFCAGYGLRALLDHRRSR